jgi:hypothetical protein
VDWTYWLLIGVTIAVPIVGFIVMARVIRKDEAIGAATFLARRGRFERSQK